MFGAQPGVYEATLVAGEEAGAIAPLMGGGWLPSSWRWVT